MEWEAWFRNKTFTNDWSSVYFANWTTHLSRFRDRTPAVLEIGSWEGRSAIFFLEFLPLCRITCIDTFAGGAEHADFDDALLSSIEARFDSNLASYDQRVRKIKSRSLPALDRLAQDNEVFDLIYIDGSHTRDDVLLDSVLAWRLLAPDGICIWDDYRWGLSDRPLAERPQPAIDAFLDLYCNELQILDVQDQVIAQKRANAGSKRVVTFPRSAANLMRFLRRRPMRYGREAPRKD
jgi:predicted O-methyltransferase YrrM